MPHQIVTGKPVINLELDVRTAAAVRQVLFEEQKIYTHDPKCTPPRIADIREFIVQLDSKIEQSLKESEE